jgi:hypothetical protein
MTHTLQSVLKQGNVFNFLQFLLAAVCRERIGAIGLCFRFDR